MEGSSDFSTPIVLVGDHLFSSALLFGHESSCALRNRLVQMVSIHIHKFQLR